MALEDNQAWTHADWESQPTPAARLTSLRAWRGELRQAITLGVSGNGHAVNSADIRQALKDSEADLLRLEQQVQVETYRPIRTSRSRRYA
jgi:hypothetical protein